MKILMLSATFPYPPTRGGTQVRTFNLMRLLAQNHDLTLVTQRSQDVTDDEIESLREYVADLVIFERPQSLKTGFRRKLERFRRFIQEGTPPNVMTYYAPEMQNWLDQAVNSGQFDVITCEHSVNEIYIRPQWRKQVTTIVNSHSSVYRTCKNQLETGTSEKPWRDRVYLPLLKRYEKQFTRKFSHIVVTTTQDQQQMQSFQSQIPVSVVPNGVDLELFPYRIADPGGYSLIFAGGLDYIVNIDAARFLCLEILPLLQQRYPEITVTLVGANPAPEVLTLAQNCAVKVTGRVPSMASYLHQATVCVIPMRTGFGIKNKTLEAMASGIPVVASDRALEGLEVYSSCCAVRANTVTEFVTAIAHLLENNRLRDELSRNGRYLVEERYTWDSAAQLYEQQILSAFSNQQSAVSF